MTSAILFLAISVAILSAIIIKTVGFSRLKEQFIDGREALGRLKGIVMAILGLSIIVFSVAYSKEVFAEEKEVKYFDYAYIFLGADYTKKQSPMCETNDIDDRWTSNLGGVLNLVSYESLRVDFTGTHHSCISGTDDKSYDALGVQVKYYFWGL